MDLENYRNRLLNKIYETSMNNSNLFSWTPDEDTEFLKYEETIQKIIMANPACYAIVHNVEKKLDQLLLKYVEQISALIPIKGIHTDIKWYEMIISRDKSFNYDAYKGVIIDVTEREKKLKSLVVENDSLNAKILNRKQQLEVATSLVWNMNRHRHPNNDRLVCNDRMMILFNLERDDDGTCSVQDFIDTIVSEVEKVKFLTQLDRLIQLEEPTIEHYVTKHNIDGSEESIFIDHNMYVIETLNGNQARTICSYMNNITETIKVKLETEILNKVNKRLIRADKLAIKSGKVMVWYQNNDEFDMVKYFYGNELFISKFGLKSEENGLITRASYHETLIEEDDESIQLKKAYLKKVRQIANNEINGIEGMIVKHKNILTGEIMYCEHATEVEERYENGQVKIDGGFIIDVTERIKQSKEIEHVANHDLLTGLKNRNFVDKYIESDQLPLEYTLIVADLDGLKLINDAFGHIKGDEAIKIATNAIKNYYEPEAVVARMGGDEFLVISTILNESFHDEQVEKIRLDLKEQSINRHFNVTLSLGSSYVNQRFISFDEAFESAENLMYRRKLNERNSRKSRTLETILDTLNARTVETHEHSFRMAESAVNTLSVLGITRNSDAEDIRLLARVHDIGKVTIPDKILFKNTRLTDDEFEVIKRHTETGYKIIKNIVDSDRIADGVLYHHERFDGTGYPTGLKGDDIPLFARIIAVCDVYDVMISGRVYQEAKTQLEAINELKRCSGTQFDPIVVTAFLKILKSI